MNNITVNILIIIMTILVILILILIIIIITIVKAGTALVEQKSCDTIYFRCLVQRASNGNGICVVASHQT